MLISNSLDYKSGLFFIFCTIFFTNNSSSSSKLHNKFTPKVSHINFTVAQVKQFLHQSKTVDAAERAYEWCMNWVAKNSNRFMPTANDVYGKIDTDHVWVVKDVLVQAMRDAGFEFNAVSRKWAEVGHLVKNSQGKYGHKTTVNSVVANCIKLTLLDSEPILSGIEVQEQPPEHFVQSELY